MGRFQNDFIILHTNLNQTNINETSESRIMQETELTQRQRKCRISLPHEWVLSRKVAGLWRSRCGAPACARTKGHDHCFFQEGWAGVFSLLRASFPLAVAVAGLWQRQSRQLPQQLHTLSMSKAGSANPIPFISGLETCTTSGARPILCFESALGKKKRASKQNCQVWAIRAQLNLLGMEWIISLKKNKS